MCRADRCPEHRKSGCLSQVIASGNARGFGIHPEEGTQMRRQFIVAAVLLQ